MSGDAKLHVIATNDGDFVASLSEKGLCSLRFPPAKTENSPSAKKLLTSDQARWLELTTRCVTDLLSGEPARELPPLDLSSGTVFQQSVWRGLLEIPFGQTRTYQEIATAVGRPGAVRAVGGACGANPIPLIIPCHRVVAANQKLGGFSGGLDWKIKLLEREGSLPTGLFPR